MTKLETSTPLTYTPTDLKSPEQALQQDNLAKIFVEKSNYFINLIAQHSKTYAFILSPTYPDKEATAAFQRLDTSLKLLESHLKLLSAIIQSEDEIDIQKTKFLDLDTAWLYPELTKKQDLSLYCLIEASDRVFYKLFDMIKLGLQLGLKVKNGTTIFEDKTNDAIRKIKIAGAKCEAIMKFFPYASMLGGNELFSQGKHGPVWDRIKEVVEYKTVADQKDIDKFMIGFKNGMGLAYAVVHDNDRAKEAKKWTDWENLRTFKNIFYYIAKKEKASIKAELKFAENNLKNAFRLWRVGDRDWAKRMRKALMPGVKVDKKIFLPRLFPAITKDKLLKEYEDGTLQKIVPNDFQAPALRASKEEILKELYKEDNQRIRLRLVSDRPLENQAKSGGKGIKGLIIHIHGGGFVALSSSVYRRALTRLTKSLDVPIFSIDYRLAPEDPYPAGLDDVWQAYNWIINYAETILGVSTEKVILQGDSAGGQLSLALTLRCIKEGVRVPDGIWAPYPALSLFEKYFVPSYMYSMDDYMLSYSILTLIIQAYVTEGMRGDIDPFLTIGLASDELLKGLPPVRITSGSADPLHDDIWLLLKRLRDLDKDVKAIVYEGMPHGFLGMVNLKGQNEMFEEMIAGIRDLFEKAGKQKAVVAGTD